MNHQTDIILAALPASLDLQSQGLTATFLFEDTLVAILHKHHPFAKHKTIKAADLRNNFILTPMIPTASLYSDKLKEIFADQGVDIFVSELGFSESTNYFELDFVSGIAILPAGNTTALPPTRLLNYVIREFEESLGIGVYAIYRRDDDTPVLSDFLTTLVDFSSTVTV
jgi:DNA-binding transcriptional LysR family regulator